MTLRDYEAGRRATCAACGRELDPESDCQHDGYEGSPHAHGGRGSYGLSPKHYVFSALCEVCNDKRTAPLRRILVYDHRQEWLACGHVVGVKRNFWGNRRPGNARFCEQCRMASPRQWHLDTVADEVRWAMCAESFPDKLRRTRRESCDAVYSNDDH